MAEGNEIYRNAQRHSEMFVGKIICVRMDDCTLARLRISPSMADVVTASLLITGHIYCNK
jgi:hypothetical protein